MRTLVLRRGRTKPLWMGHPWVHADSVKEVRDDGVQGPEDLVLVEDEERKRIGWALHSPSSLLCARIVSRAVEAPDLEQLLGERIETAVALRQRLFPDPTVTNAYRLIHSEGDGLPGLVVDRFGPLLSAQFSTAPMHRRRDLLSARLLAATGAEGLIARAGGHEADEDIADDNIAFARGAPAPDRLEVREPPAKARA